MGSQRKKRRVTLGRKHRKVSVLLISCSGYSRSHGVAGESLSSRVLAYNVCRLSSHMLVLNVGWRGNKKDEIYSYCVLHDAIGEPMAFGER